VTNALAYNNSSALIITLKKFYCKGLWRNWRFIDSFYRRHDTQNNDTQYNDTQHNDTQYKGL